VINLSPGFAAHMAARKLPH